MKEKSDNCTEINSYNAIFINYSVSFDGLLTITKLLFDMDRYSRTLRRYEMQLNIVGDASF